MGDDQRKALQKELGLVQVSINDVVTQLNAGKVVQAAILASIFRHSEDMQRRIAVFDPASTKGLLLLLLTHTLFSNYHVKIVFDIRTHEAALNGV